MARSDAERLDHDEPTPEEITEVHAGIADVYDKSAAQAFQRGDYDKALTFLGVARNMDPSRSALWDNHTLRVKTTESQHTPLDELLDRRLGRLSRGLDDPAVRQWAEHNHEAQLRSGIEDPEVGQ